MNLSCSYVFEAFPKAPGAVKAWSNHLPRWIEVHPIASPPNLELRYLDRGEREAIQLAEEHSGSLLIDDRKDRIEAKRRGLYATGTYHLEMPNQIALQPLQEIDPYARRILSACTPL